MGLHYQDLSPDVRAFMMVELEGDITAGQFYVGKYLNTVGQTAWPDLLRRAFAQHDDDWLADQVETSGLLEADTQRQKPHGGVTSVPVRRDAAQMLAEGEFNRFYVRGVCRLAIAQRIGTVVVYRGKDVAQPRPESIARVGAQLNAAALLEDLRLSQGVEPALGVPPGPNSGLTVRLT